MRGRSAVLRRAAAVLLLPCYLAACHRWVPSQEPVAVVASEGPRSLRVTLADGSRLVLRQAYLAADSLIGVRDAHPAKLRQAVALADIVSFEIAELNPVTSAMAVAVGAAAAGLLVAGVALAMNPPSCPLVYGWDGEGWSTMAILSPRTTESARARAGLASKHASFRDGLVDLVLRCNRAR